MVKTFVTLVLVAFVLGAAASSYEPQVDSIQAWRYTRETDETELTKGDGVDETTINKVRLL
jgi:hypothetical protein